MNITEQNSFVLQKDEAKLVIENTSDQPHDIELSFTIIDTQKRSFLTKLKGLFSEELIVIKADRVTTKNISNFIYKQITTADQLYKEKIKSTQSSESANEQPKKRKSNKPNTTSASRKDKAPIQ